MMAIYTWMVTPLAPSHDALWAGATEAEIMEALGVAMLMGGGPSVIYATHVIEAMQEFQAGEL